MKYELQTYIKINPHYSPGQTLRVPGRLRLPHFKTIGT
jgi:hypothetical protein